MEALDPESVLPAMRIPSAKSPVAPVVFAKRPLKESRFFVDIIISMYVKVRVTPGAPKERVEKKSADHVNVWVRQPAERNLANKRVIEIIRELFRVTEGEVKIISGHRSLSKIISIDAYHENK